MINQSETVNHWVTITVQVVDKPMDNSCINGSKHVTQHSTNITLHSQMSPEATPIPKWVPASVQRYLTHTEAGLTIREVARRSGCHASTVLRQIRKIETRRDDPMVDRALHALSSQFFHGSTPSCAKESPKMDQTTLPSPAPADTPDMDRQAMRILRRLCETGAVLAVADGMETAVVVRETQQGSTNKTASVSAEFVSVLALNAWIECDKMGRISRYRITPAGRAKLVELGEAMPSTGIDGLAEKRRTYDEKLIEEDSQRRRVRYNACESPVSALARRKNKDGSLFLSDELVNAAERMREDFELSQMGPRVTQNWETFLTAGSNQGGAKGDTVIGSGPSDACARVEKALLYLGPGLADVALRCCCYLEGLESAEKRMGWSARSGKIVLRIALGRLQQFYETELGDVLIG